MEFRILFAAALFGLVPMVFAQQSGAPTTTAASAATASAATGCAKAVTIYLDASGTMTKPMRNRGNRLPIGDIAQTLLRFVGTENFLGTGDTVTVKVFGSTVRTRTETLEQAQQLLTLLANTSNETEALNALGAAHGKTLTDFSRLFDDIENRIRNASLRRQIIFVASDFAHDQLNNGGCSNDVTPRVENFASALARIRPVLQSALAPAVAKVSRVQIAGLYAPEGTCASDNQVGRTVQEALKAEGMRLYRFDEDAAEAALTLSNDLKGTVTAKPVTPVIRIGADDRVPFTIDNPNCVDVTVVALQFNAGMVKHRFDIDPLTISGGARETRVDVAKLGSIWNQDVQITPLLAPGPSVNTEESTAFWLGDWIRVRRLTPYLYPRTIRQGQTLVEAVVERSLRTPAGLMVSGVDAAGRSRLFQFDQGEGEDSYVLPFNLNTALKGRLSAAGTKASLSTTGIRLLTDEVTAIPTTDVPLTSGIASAAAEFLDGFAMSGVGLYVGLLLMIAARSFSRHGDDETEYQWQSFWNRAKTGVVGGLTSGTLFTPFGWLRIPWMDDWLLLAASWRAVAAGVATGLFLRTLLVEVLWKRSIEPRLLPTDRAVLMRKRWNALIYGAALAAAISVLYTFFVGPAANPSPGANIVRGVTR